MSDSALMVLRYITESVWGTTPAVALKTIPITSFRPGYTKETFGSQRYHGDPQMRRVGRGSHHSTPSFGTELSYADLDDFLAVFLRSTWSLNTPSTGIDRLRNGILRTSMTLEAEYPDLTGNTFMALKGCRPNVLSLSFQPGSMVGVNASFMGLIPIFGGATVGTGAATAAADKDPLSAIENITLLEEGGSSVAEVLGIELTITNEVRAKPVITDEDMIGVGMGPFTVTGSVSMYFESKTHFEKVINHTSSALQATLVDAAGNSLDLEVLQLRYTGGDPDASGPNVDIPITLEFTAEKESATGKTIQFTRNPA